jgi:NTP pyrophosphatase (non-canonical NTP hydrolase)
MNTIKNLQVNAHNISKLKGFWDDKDLSKMDIVTRNLHIAQCLALIHSEVSEALEILRKKDDIHAPLPNLNGDDFVYDFKLLTKDSFGDELADTVIRVLDLAEACNLDLEGHIVAKMKYNSTREHKNGGKKF